MQCYKSVCYDIEKASKKVHKKQRLNVLYIISDICKPGPPWSVKDKYGMLTRPTSATRKACSKIICQNGPGRCCYVLQCDVEWQF